MSASSAVAEPQLNATPLIDVMLVLLIMLIFTLPIATHAVKLNLPRGPSAPPVAVVQVDIFYDGEIYWNGEHLASIEQLTPRFTELARRASPPLVQVVPEKRAPYGRVAQVLAAAQRSRVERLSVLPVADL